jgi:hypothetical protein
VADVAPTAARSSAAITGRSAAATPRGRWFALRNAERTSGRFGTVGRVTEQAHGGRGFALQPFYELTFTGPG